MAAFHQLQCMRSFMAVAEHGSFSRAAHALQVGAASVSEHVGNLEKHLGVSLLHRTTRSLQLTHEGVRYLDMCRDILPRIDEMDGDLAREDRAAILSGVLRIEMSDGVDAFLLDAVQDFQDKHPAVSIHILRSQRQFDLAEASADIAIRSIAPQGATPNRIVSRILGQSRTTFLAAPAYLERHGVPDCPEALHRHRCIGYIDPVSGRLWEWYFAGPDGRSFTLDMPCALALAQGDLRRRAAVAGQGIINDIAHFAAPLVQQGLLVPLLENWTMPQPVCHISHHRERYRSARIDAFLDHLEHWFAALPAAPF